MSSIPLPVIDADSAPFWAAARRRVLLLPFSPTSGRYHFFPRALDPFTWDSDLEWRQASGRGRIYSFTIVRRAPEPAFAAQLPYVVALVDLDEGPRMMSTIVTDAVESVRIGQRVAVVFDRIDAEITLPRFHVVEGES